MGVSSPRWRLQWAPKLAEARLRPAGYAAAAFASFATKDWRVACRAVACEASEGWWSQAGSNRRPLACHASALPAELWPLNLTGAPWATRGMQNPEHSSGSISSLFVAADVADNVGDVLVALFFVGDEG